MKTIDLNEDNAFSFREILDDDWAENIRRQAFHGLIIQDDEGADDFYSNNGVIKDVFNEAMDCFIHITEFLRIQNQGNYTLLYIRMQAYTFQISFAYCRMVRSEENLPAQATFIRHLRAKAASSIPASRMAWIFFS